ncbi:FtsK/SpoIIIE domain-containing protein [Cellulomonas cellasea]|uniref:FtsK domain-containing protein n=2 Tax=Cellulomonas cellasea TaxID=43670 RepID=A0A0A0B5A1_9CELL|nr:FtsK/SpoIIIE domain-containing protein [Cellulomonas cellasea]KGM02005.1 hypothetical protein Q760_16115 [Cellulomonas cellasea DSM 20118]GEA90109.1 hypothetical protein CCE01nite_40580 [Cellulomonas cellasea]
MTETNTPAGDAGTAAVLAVLAWRLLRLVFTPFHRRVWVYACLVLGMAERAHGAGVLGATALASPLAWWLLRTSWAPASAWYAARETEHRAGRYSRERSQAARAVLAHLNLDAEVVVASFPFGDELTVRIPHGGTRAQVLNAAPALREALGYLTLNAADDDAPGVVKLNGVTRDLLSDPLEGPAPVAADGWEAAAGSWVTVALDRNGKDVELPLFLPAAGGLRYLIAGASGSGKSSCQTQLTVAAIRSGARVWLADPKQTEMAGFRPWAERYATTPDGIVEMLEALCVEMRARQGALAGQFQSCWTLADGPVVLLVVDELSAVTMCGDKKLKERGLRALEDLAARSRSAGITLILTTQQPTTDVIPSVIRSNLDIRIGHRVMTATVSDVIIPGSARDGLGAPHDIPGSYDRSGRLTCAGVFYLDGMGPRTLARAWYIPQAEVPDILTGAGVLPVVRPAQEASRDRAPSPTSSAGEPDAARPERRPRRRRTPAPGA